MTTGNLHNRIAVLPLGATEQHGPHLPLETDSIIASGICKRLGAANNDEHELVFLPVEEIGYSPEHMDYNGSKSLSWDEAVNRWISIGERLAKDGIRKLVLLNAHGGNSPLMIIVATELRCRFNMLCVYTSWLRFGEPEGLFEDGERQFGIHGGDIETSVMLVFAPEKVNMHKADSFSSLQQGLVAANRFLHAYGRHGFGWKMQDLNPQGVTGNAGLASAEKGEALIAHSVRGLKKLIDEVARFDLALLENQPEATNDIQEL